MQSLMHSDFVDGYDARVLEAGGSFRFRVETPDEFFAGKSAMQQHLHRYHPVQTPLPRLINHAHAAAADLPEQFVVAEVANQGIGDRHRGWRAGSSAGSGLPGRQAPQPLTPG